MLMQNPNIPEDWKQTIRDYIPKDEREAAEKAEILTLIDREGERLLLRDCAYAHMTASSIIVNGARTKTLMACFTKSIRAGLDGRPATAKPICCMWRCAEAKEETGIEHLRLIGGGVASLEILPVWAHVKRGRAVGSHLHLNVSYLFEADDTLPLRVAEDENSAVGWLGIDRLDEYVSEARHAADVQKDSEQDERLLIPYKQYAI